MLSSKSEKVKYCIHIGNVAKLHIILHVGWLLFVHLNIVHNEHRYIDICISWTKKNGHDVNDILIFVYHGLRIMDMMAMVMDIRMSWTKENGPIFLCESFS